MFALSDVDLSLVFKELDVGVSDFELFAGFKDQTKELLLNDGLGQLTVVLGLPVPRVRIPN